MRRLAVLALGSITFLAACGSSGKATTCDTTAQTGCAAGKACELVEGGAPACFDPVVLKGKVTDLATGTAIAGARLVGLDANRAPAGTVVTSARDGGYTLTVASQRKADGTPSGSVALRADAKAYQSFPAGVRVALPIDLSGAVHTSGAWTVQSSLTDVALIALPTGAGNATIHGTVASSAAGSGTLVVAEPVAGGTGVTGVADRSGSYAVFNLAPGTYSVTAYRKGANYTPGQVDLAASDDKVVDLALKDTATATVTGDVNPVAGASGSPTSVILVVESTFNAALGRGDSPPGLRDPTSGLGVTGAFSIAGIPDGKYVALAAFEDDGLVRDVASTGGTAPLEVVVSGGAMTSAPGSFKITTPVVLVSPGAAGPELGIANPPQFVWNAYPATDHYRVTVFDTFGNEQWRYDYANPPSNGTISVSYGQPGGTPSTAPALTSGMYYQVQVESFGTQATQYSRTEDLKGVFTVQ